MKRQKSKSSSSELSKKKNEGRKYDHDSSQSHLENPDYLLEGFVKKHCSMIGIIHDIPTNDQLVSRHYLLTKLDKNRNSGHLPWQINSSHRVSLNISAYNIRVIQQSGDFPTVHRIPIHDVASISYVRDDDDHLLFIKAGKITERMCPVYVFLCSSQIDAEGICNVLQQTFELVYTEATMLHLKESINVGAKYQHQTSQIMHNASKGMGSTGPQKVPPQRQLSRAEQSLPELTFSESFNQRSSTHLNSLSPPAARLPPRHSLSLATADTSGDSQQAEELVIEYMDRLHKQLKFEELQRFASLLKSYREGASVVQFCQQLKDLYGKEREFLLPDMRSFIPEDDSEVFEAFLVEHNLKSDSYSPSASKVLVPSLHSSGSSAPILSGSSAPLSSGPPVPSSSKTPAPPSSRPPAPSSSKPPVPPSSGPPAPPSFRPQAPSSAGLPVPSPPVTRIPPPPPAPPVTGIPPPPPPPPPPIVAPPPLTPSPSLPTQATPPVKDMRLPHRERNRHQSGMKREISDSLDHYLEDIDNTMDDLMELTEI